jgi:hypothetical protein
LGLGDKPDKPEDLPESWRFVEFVPGGCTRRGGGVMDTAREKAARRRAGHIGYRLRKSRIDGTWTVIDAFGNWVVAGSRHVRGEQGFDFGELERFLEDDDKAVSLADILAELRRREKETA